MKRLKFIFIFYSFIFLTGCLQTTAFVGPTITVMSTGNVLQAGLQYGANTAIKNETGKYPLTHIKETVEEENNLKNFQSKLINFIEKNIKTTKKKLSIN
tara:strand:+ start:196 stop:492 length:297 start_codon:yes stop_codon:yes gene_type:complete